MGANGCEVLVIGEGLSGIVAAATAATEGSRVTLISKGPGNFVLGSGCIDLDGQDRAKLGLIDDRLEAAVSFFLDLTASADCAYSGGAGERHLVPTILGTFQEVSLAPRWLWQADPNSINNVLVAGIANLPGFDAKFIAERLTSDCKRIGLTTSYRSEVVTLPHNPNHALTALEVATQVDRDNDFRSALARALRPLVQDAELLIMPGILGVKSNDTDIVCFEEDIGCAVCEFATLPPSVPGLRLLQRLERRLMQLSVNLSIGFPVRKLCIEGQHCVGVELDTPGRPRQLRANTVVLACGRFSDLLEPAMAEFTGYGSHFDNVFGCGCLLGHFEPRHRNAVSILTGHQAGMLASKQGVQYAGR
jgi:glycerol-3-phosphate dehydrogenase subunit B